jgi:superoxide oxidase
MPRTATREHRMGGLPLEAAHSGSIAKQGGPARGGPDTAPGRYDVVARLLHWVFALAIIYASIVGYSLARIANRPVHDFLSRLNMSLATVLIVLFPLRVLWKFKRVDPRPIEGLTDAQRKLAHGAHHALYLTIAAVLASGFLMVPHGYSFFGLLEVRTPFEKGPLTDALFLAHRVSCAVLVGFVALHVLAVCKHQLVNRNNVLRRML